MDTVSPGVHQIGRYVNAFVVDGDQGVVLIDTGLPRREGLVTKALATIGRSTADVRAIVLTHAHVDHVGSAAALEALTGATVIAPLLDTPAIQGTEPLPHPPMFRGAMGLFGRILPGAEPVVVDHMVTENSDDALPDDFRAIDTPGHTPGHTSFLLERGGGVMFVGDAAASDRRGAVIRGFPNLRGGPIIDTSIRHLGGFEFAIALFGHSAPIVTGASEAFRAFRD
jgi:glyoxylase-like metal-dependent hydrolase (beta-lactamase superfamily II)